MLKGETRAEYGARQLTDLGINELPTRRGGRAKPFRRFRESGGLITPRGLLRGGISFDTELRDKNDWRTFLCVCGKELLL